MGVYEPLHPLLVGDESPEVPAIRWADKHHEGLLAFGPEPALGAFLLHGDLRGLKSAPLWLRLVYGPYALPY